MEVVKISKGGQISIPARIRKRWGVHKLLIEERGETLVMRPIPDDPLKAARGSLPARRHTVEEDRRRTREEEIEAEERKWRRIR
jgi:AbrB family looped-hinge helix DNA binding protein